MMQTIALEDQSVQITAERGNSQHCLERSFGWLEQILASAGSGVKGELPMLASSVPVQNVFDPLSEPEAIPYSGLRLVGSLPWVPPFEDAQAMRMGLRHRTSIRNFVVTQAI